jgi:hypothetical protein
VEHTSNEVHSHPWALEAEQAADLERWLTGGTKGESRWLPPEDWGGAADPAAGGGLNLDHSYIRCTGAPKPAENRPPEPVVDDGQWYVQQKVVDNYCEFVAIEDSDHDLQRRNGGCSKKVEREVTDQPSLELNFDELFEKNEKARRRSQRGLKWAVLGLAGDRIWTLTARGRIATYAEAWALWGKFEVECSKRFAKFKCVAVVEPHQIDGYHIHFVTNGFFLVSSMRLWWHRILTGRALSGILRGEESPGNVQVGNPHGSRKIAKYLAKYLGKSFAGLQSVRIKRYAASKGIRAPVVTRTRMPSSMGGEIYHLHKLAEADGWKVGAYFEGIIMGRKMIWLQCIRAKPQPASILEN